LSHHVGTGRWKNDNPEVRSDSTKDFFFSSHKTRRNCCCFFCNKKNCFVILLMCNLAFFTRTDDYLRMFRKCEKLWQGKRSQILHPLVESNYLKKRCKNITNKSSHVILITFRQFFLSFESNEIWLIILFFS
jgi:hypothetical protein